MVNSAVLIISIITVCIGFIILKNLNQFKYTRSFKSYNKFESDVIQFMQSLGPSVKPVDVLNSILSV